MSQSEYSLELPPPRRPGRRRGHNLLWLLITFIALALGAAGGVWLGKSYGGFPHSERSIRNESVEKMLEEARNAVSEGELGAARTLYREILVQVPGNPEAETSLALVEELLREAVGGLVIATDPPGATVTIEGRSPVTTPAEIRDLPAGEHRLVLDMDGFVSVEKTVSVEENRLTELPPVLLDKNQGELELVSEPRGADFKVLKASPSNPGDLVELVEVGKTPARLEELEAGEYEVQMAVEGWPNYSQRIKVLHNRSTSVSAVFASGGVNIVSDPAGAEVWLSSGEANFTKQGFTPLILSDLSPGRHQVEVRYRDWTPIRRTVEVKGNATRNLEFTWERSMVTFTSDPPGADVYLDHRRVGREKTPFSLEFPEGEYLFEARINGLNRITEPLVIDGSDSSRVRFSFPYGSVSIESSPPGARVVANGIPVGLTPLRIPVVAPGAYSYLIEKENYKRTTLSGVVEPGGTLEFNTGLVPDQAPAINRNFVNGLGQKMIWFGNLGGWVADTETTQAAYERITGKNPSDIQNPKHPVDSVNWYEATRFCENLTVFERGLGNVPPGFQYRLPTDAEWSAFAGETSLTNAVTSLQQRQRSPRPVGSVAPNSFGLYDIRGNVAEWVQDWYSQRILNLARQEGSLGREDWIGTDRKVLRGGSWLTSSQVSLAVPYRKGARPSQEEMNDVGFRVVLMPR